MLIASFVPATVKLRSDFSLSSTAGLITSFPSTLPTITPAIGPSNGILLIPKAREDPNIAVISGVESKSQAKTVFITCTSFLNPSGNIGLIGLSISLAVNVPCSPGLPSLLKNPPGIFPIAYIFS